MLRLDSIKILAPMDTLIEYDTKHFKEKKEVENGLLMSDTLTTQNIDFGFNRFVIDKKANNLVIEVSAKLLKDDYAQGINIDTFEQVISNINASKRVKIDASMIYSKGQLLRADVTDNIKMDTYKGSDLYTDLACIPLQPKYDITPYGKATANRTGLVFKGKQKTFKERVILYDKSIELQSTALGNAFLNSINRSKLLNSFKHTYRVEGNFTQLKTIRKYIGSNQLSDVLASNEKVNYKLFKKITSSANINTLTLFDKYEGMTWRAIIQRQGIEGIIKSAEYNWQYIELLIKKHTGSNYRRERIKFKSVFNELIKSQLKHSDIKTNTSVIDLFLTELLNVA